MLVCFNKFIVNWVLGNVVNGKYVNFRVLLLKLECVCVSVVLNVKYFVVFGISVN